MPSQPIDWRYMTNDTRARVYLVWAFLAPIGFATTHFHQRSSINGLWWLISLAGLGYMLKVMPLRVRKLRLIYLAWLVPIIIGLIVSVLVFKLPVLYGLIPVLGGFWLMILSAGYFLNGLVDPPRLWYWLAAGLNLAAGLAVFLFDQLLAVQYLLAAIVSGWSMLNLWLFRVD